MTKAGERLLAAGRQAVEALRNTKAEDPRPRKGGWAPGGYMCLCRDCNEHFIGDKRAIFCADCAYKGA